MSAEATIIHGYVSENQARRSSDGYDDGVVRMNVYEPDHEYGDPSYDTPAQMILTGEKLFTESQVREMLEAMLSERQDDYGRSVIMTDDLRAVATKYGVTLELP